MLTHDPDMTRLLDRLEKRELLERSRDKTDRRVVRTHITAAGMILLAGLDAPIMELHQAQLGHLGSRDLKSGNELLRRSGRANRVNFCFRMVLSLSRITL